MSRRGCYPPVTNFYYRELRADWSSWRALRKKLLHNQNSKCAYCLTGISTRTMNIEHVIPVKRGGDNSKENLVAACWVCNKVKGNKKLKPKEMNKLKDNLNSLKMETKRYPTSDQKRLIKETQAFDAHIRSIMNEQ